MTAEEKDKIWKIIEMNEEFGKEIEKQEWIENPNKCVKEEENGIRMKNNTMDTYFECLHCESINSSQIENGF